MRRTKIVCTIGPASESPEMIEKLLIAGMNVARLNFSHGNHQEHAARIETIRKAAKRIGKTVGILLDTKGPEIRTGDLEDGKIFLEEGREVVLTTEEVPGNAQRLSVSCGELPADVRQGDEILLDDGLIALKVLSTTSGEINCLVENGGELGSHKGVNVPGVRINLPALTDKDLADICFGIEKAVDYIAASFIRSVEDVLTLRRVLEERQADIPIIAKIETRSGVDNIDAILQAADGIMVARGDLGVEIPSEEVPLVQKMIIKKCNQAGKPVITATQMLDSMIRNPRPTRAEASDVANAILDGTDAVMLSGETAAGKFPLQSLSTMGRIAQKVEEELNYRLILSEKQSAFQQTVTESISHATCAIAMDLNAAAIVTPTASGSTARMVSKYRPKAPIIAASPRENVLRRLTLSWGVQPILVEQTSGTDEMISAAVSAALAVGMVNCGDLLVITAGVPAGVPGTTNLLKVHIVGEVILKGMGIGQGVAAGKVRLIHTAQEAQTRVQEGDILVTAATDKEFVPAMQKAAAVIVEEGGLTSHAAIVGLSLKVPVVVGARDATQLLQDNSVVTVDGRRGLIYRGVTKVI